MIGYVLDGDVNRAMKNVEGAVKTHHVALGMAAPGEMNASSISPTIAGLKETSHVRAQNAETISVQHWFAPVTAKPRLKASKPKRANLTRSRLDP
jgi:hypothetical protein